MRMNSGDKSSLIATTAACVALSIIGVWVLVLRTFQPKPLSSLTTNIQYDSPAMFRVATPPAEIHAYGFAVMSEDSGAVLRVDGLPVRKYETQSGKIVKSSGFERPKDVSTVRIELTSADGRKWHPVHWEEAK